MNQANDTHVLLRAFVDELVRCGVTTVATAPGSRSSPLVLALVRDGRLTCHSHIDERCAAFFALGAALATGRPAVVTCTSGTAAANLAPAVIEAHEAGVPLLVLTADRPPELREVGAGQTIDQLKLYGTAVRWFFEVGSHEATPQRTRWMRTLACRAHGTAKGSADARPGPVHLNFPLREPLVPDGLVPEPAPGREDGSPWLQDLPPCGAPDAVAGWIRDALAGGRASKGLMVAGRSRGASGLAARFAEAAGWPLLADPLSGLRRGGAAIAHYDALLRDEGFKEGHRPDLVLRVGDLPTSKPLRQWLASLDDVVQVALRPAGVWHDPDGVVRELLRGEPFGALEDLPDPPLPEWLESWRGADAAAAQAIATALDDELSEPRVARELGAVLPPDATLFVAASMPIRDVEAFVAVRDDPPRMLANRGANGIDGTVSTAFGVAAGAKGPVVLLTGDLAVLHDIGGLLAARRLNLTLTIVVLNNDGGGIFEFLPIAGETDVFEQHVATPHGLDLADVAALYGLEHHRPDGITDFRAALSDALTADTTTLIEVRTDRKDNLALHRQVAEAVLNAL